MSISPTKSVPVQNLNSRHLAKSWCELKKSKVLGGEGGAHEMLKTISPTRSVPVQNSYVFNNMVQNPT